MNFVMRAIEAHYHDTPTVMQIFEDKPTNVRIHHNENFWPNEVGNRWLGIMDGDINYGGENTQITEEIHVVMWLFYRSLKPQQILVGGPKAPPGMCEVADLLLLTALQGLRNLPWKDYYQGPQQLVVVLPVGILRHEEFTPVNEQPESVGMNYVTNRKQIEIMVRRKRNIR